jgi:hypothetical protein
MRPFLRFIVLSLLAQSAIAQTQSLQDLGAGTEPGSRVFLDSGDMQFVGELRIVDIRTVPDPNGPRKSPKGEGEVIDYTVQRHTFNCAKSSFHIDSLMYYYIDGDYDTDNYDADDSWQQVAAGSLQEKVLKQVCAIAATKPT